MSESFLYSLSDTSENIFVFGKPVHEYVSIFIDPEIHWLKDTVQYIQLYKGHELKLVHSSPQHRENISPDWFFPLVLIVFGVFAWIRMAYNKYFMQMIQAFLNSNLANQIVRDENIFVQRASIYLSIVFNLILALLIYLVSIHYQWNLGDIGNGFGRFMFFLIVVSVAYTIKFLILKICGWLFEQEREMATYIFNIFIINNILGMVLIPFVVILAYNESIAVSWVLSIPVVLIVLSFGWRLFRGVQIGLASPSFSPLYLFLYLCTLEIAPLLVLIRIIVS